MKLECEIKDGIFTYSYEVGSSKHNSSSPLSLDLCVGFINLLQMCGHITKCDLDKRFQLIGGKAWIEGNIEEAENFIKEYKKSKKL